MGNACFKCSNFEEKEEDDDHNHHERINSPPDRISDLPGEISHHILSFLPFKTVAQTCVLSRRWSHLWSSYLIIDLNKVFFGNETQARIINSVLACRDKQYNVKVSRDNELAVKISIDESGKSDFPPRCRLKGDSLETIEFKTCSSGSNSETWLEFPSSYVIGSYLHSLHTLKLTGVNFLDNNLFRDLFSGSSFPCLESLCVRSCRGITDLKIASPKLECLTVRGMDITNMDISGMRLESLTVVLIKCTTVNIFAPNVRSLVWWFNKCMTQNGSIKKFPALKTLEFDHECPLSWDSRRMQMYQSSVVNLLLASSHVQKTLTILEDALCILSKNYFEGGLPFSFTELEELGITTYLEKTAIPGIACLFKSSPVVHTLKIKVMNAVRLNNNNKWDNTGLDDANCTEDQYWETQAQNLSPFLSHLKVVEIIFRHIIPDTESVISLARFLLKYGRSLQQIKLTSFIDPPLNLLNDTVALMESFPRRSAYVKFSIGLFDLFDPGV